MDQLLTIQQVAAYLNVSPKFFHDARGKGLERASIDESSGNGPIQAGQRVAEQMLTSIRQTRRATLLGIVPCVAPGPELRRVT